MAQLFPRWTNRLALIGALVAPAFGGLALVGVWYYGSPRYTDVGYRPHQPVAYSHRLHVGELGLDCRYCHSSVESSPVANVPPTQVCMNCHQIVKNDSALLAPIRESSQTGRPMRWIRVHNLPDYAYFDHSVHVRAGVGCASCHGRVDQMEEVMQVEPLSMSWCLDCHRQPQDHLRPASEVTNMDWFPAENQAESAREIIAEKQLEPPVDCSGCHR